MYSYHCTDCVFWCCCSAVLGANAILGVSMAVCKAGAGEKVSHDFGNNPLEVSLYAYVAGGEVFMMVSVWWWWWRW